MTTDRRRPVVRREWQYPSHWPYQDLNRPSYAASEQHPRDDWPADHELWDGSELRALPTPADPGRLDRLALAVRLVAAGLPPSGKHPQGSM